jgi:hypothetical protein
MMMTKHLFSMKESRISQFGKLFSKKSLLDPRGVPEDSIGYYARNFDVYISPNDGKLLKIMADPKLSRWKYVKAKPAAER